MLGKLRRDNNSYWYLIPLLYIEEFKEFQEYLYGKKYNECPDKFDFFEEFFGRFRINGPYEVKCIIDKEYY